MDIFAVHRHILDDYANYIRSFVSIADDTLRERVEKHLDDGHLWPEPLLTVNPSFAKVGRVEELAASGVLAAPLECPESHQMSTFFLDTYYGASDKDLVTLKSFERSSVRIEPVAEDFRHVGLLPGG
jgi:hypothetical protein